MISALPAPPPIQRQKQKQVPLSYSQESLWFLQQLDPENNAYNYTILLKFIGGIDHLYLQQSLNELVRRHEPLRTIYPSQGGQAIQVIQPYESFSLPCLDFSGLAKGELEQTIRWYVSENGDKPYDLQRGPLIRYALLHSSSNDDYFFFGIHHIAFDGWSRQIFISELMQLYDAYNSGKDRTLSELPIQYADYALWQREWLSGETLAAYVEHWKNILSGDLPVLELPIDRPRPTIQTYRGDTYYFNLPQALSSQMRSFCRREHMTLFQVLLAAYALLLMRYTGQEDIIIGCPFANRAGPELDGLVGMFTNTLPIRVNLSGNPNVRALLDQIRAVIMDAFIWQAAPFESLVSEISPERDLSRTPVFQVAINLMYALKKPQTIIEGLVVEDISRQDAPAPFEIILDFQDDGDLLDASLRYNVDLYDESTIIRMAAHFQNLLRELLTKCDRPAAELEMLAPSERQRIVEEWSKRVTEYSPEKCIHQVFEEQVERTPDAIGVVFEDQRLTYHELNVRANQLARYLRSFGVGPDVLVGICLDRSLEMIIGLLGILKAGGAYVPIDPAYPPERIALILEDIRSPVMVTQLRYEEKFHAHSKQVIRLDADWGMLSKQSENNLPINIQPDNLAYAIYTSGSTGKPKGVLVSHYNVVRLFQATQNWFRFDNNDVWTLFHSFVFDFSVWEIWGALLYGGQLIVIPYLMSRSPEAFYNLLVCKKVTVLNQTPSAFYQLIQVNGEASENDLHLRLIIFGGEALDVHSLKPWFDQHGDERPLLVNMYGITETTVHVTYHPLSQRDLAGKAVNAIGIPIPDLQVYLIDAHGLIVPIGVPGEIHVGGAGVSRGYLNNPELSSEKFIHNPFSADPNTRLYKSGDLARWLPDGQLEYLGRRDSQIKLRGYRIELSEIEIAIRQYPEVRQAVVVLREDKPGEKRLVAYIVPASAITLNEDGLRGFLREKLPNYMIPSVFVGMDKLPLMVSGKIDRKALPLPEMSTFGDRKFIAPRNQTEQILSNIWMVVLGISRVSMEDNFYDVGGDSLSALRVMARIRDEFNIAIPVRRIFEYSRLSELAAQVDFELFYQKHSSGLQGGSNERAEPNL